MKHLAIFASGTGSNTQMIIGHFNNLTHSATGGNKGEGFDNPKTKVSLIVSNNPSAGVFKIASKENIPVLLINREKFFRGDGYVTDLKEKQIDFIVLAGFLWKIPDVLIKAYPGRIINIHPALLPAYGGKGMYGNKVHEAVIANGEKESGISIHYVDEHYDNGDIILQVKCHVLPGDTPELLAERIHGLEYEYYPKIIEKLVDQLIG